MTKRAVVYARISVASEESVSVARQLASARQYAKARGWKVVGEFIDEGVSATHNRPESRAGWQALLASPRDFDAVVIWKVDRLARRVIDFLRADESLQARGSAIVCVEQSIDMTTGEGRAFAQMLAVFGEMESSTMSSRMSAARTYLLANGRSPGGLQPYGWRVVPNPDGAGSVRALHPEQIVWVRGMAERALRGDTVYSIVQWLSAAGAPTPRTGAPGTWAYSSVTNLLLNPILAGMTSCNPGRRMNERRGPEVLRNAAGEPVIAPDLAIISVAEHKALAYLLANKEHHAAISRNLRRKSSPILSLLVTCADCDLFLHRFSFSKQHKVVLRCRRCGQCVTQHLLVTYLEGRLLSERGRLKMYRRTLVVPGDADASRKLAQIEDDLRTAALALTSDGADVAGLSRRIVTLKRARENLRRTSKPVDRLAPLDRTLQQVWQLCTTDEQRREILAGQFEHLSVRRGRKGGRGLDQTRVSLVWSTVKAIAPNGISLDAVPATLPTPPPTWISCEEAAVLVGCTAHVLRRVVRKGLIQRRSVARSYPSLSRVSVLAYAEVRRQQGPKPRLSSALRTVARPR